MTLPRRIVALTAVLVLCAACTNTDLTSGEAVTAAGMPAAVTVAAE